MNPVFRIAAVACAVLLPSQAIAAEAKCVSRPELRTGIAYIMPALMKGVVTKCAATLAADSYLAKDGAALIARYSSESKGNDAEVRALFSKFVPIEGLAGADGQSMAALVESLVTVGIQSAVKPETCSDISAAMALLDPLPAANMNGLVEFVLVKVDQDNARKRAASEGDKTDKTKDVKKGRSAPFLCETLAMTSGAPR